MTLIKFFFRIFLYFFDFVNLIFISPFFSVQVNFIISDSTALNRRRRSGDKQQHSRIEASDAQLYRDLAQASGGQAIEVTKSELPVAISLITESSSSSLVMSQRYDYRFSSVTSEISAVSSVSCHLQVTLLQAARNPGKADNFSFIVDESVTNPTVYITGRSVTITLVSPTGSTCLFSL